MPEREIISTKQSASLAKDVFKITSSEKSLIQDLKDTAQANNLDCLSAPALGAFKKITVLRERQDEDFIVMINPVIIDGFGEKVILESDSLKNEDKFRLLAEMILVEYQNEFSENVQRMFTDYSSYYIQVEVGEFENESP
tara:strand:- start:410 stop:829 length:420 start_codon:yes stop_codon:yes gene_type:complete